MEKLVASGKVRALGVSNFNHKQLQRLINEGTIKPSVLQVERNPRFSQVRKNGPAFFGNLESRSIEGVFRNHRNENF